MKNKHIFNLICKKNKNDKINIFRGFSAVKQANF